ncbi:hypothetical protein OFB74_32100, partial [Escherichia coli]|nr:hypothetical protein [Escherichia coli]
DQLVLRSPLPLIGQLRDAHIALLRFEDARHNLVSLVSATLALIGRSEGARAFAEMLRAWLLARMREPQGFSWHLDQAGLAVVHLSMRG